MPSGPDERRLGRRCPAGEALAHVDGRLPVDEALALEQRNALRRADRDDRAAARRAPAPRVPPGCRRARRSRSRAAARARGRARRAPTPKAPGARPSIGSTRRSTRDRRGARARRRPRSAPSRSSTCASIELPEGIGLSSSPFVRATSSSPPVGARKKPPCSASCEELDREQGEAARLVQPAELAGRDVELEQPVGRVRVVVEEALAAHLPVPPRAREPPVLAARAARAGTPPRLAPRRASRPARAAARLPRAPRARARSRRRAPCRRGRAAACAPAPRAASREARGRAHRGRSSGRARTAGAARPGTPSSSVHVNVSPSTPFVSASCAEARPPSGRRSSRST